MSLPVICDEKTTRELIEFVLTQPPIVRPIMRELHAAMVAGHAAARFLPLPILSVDAASRCAWCGECFPNHRDNTYCRVEPR